MASAMPIQVPPPNWIRLRALFQRTVRTAMAMELVGLTLRVLLRDFDLEDEGRLNLPSPIHA